MKEFQIGKHIIGKNHPTFIVAEVSANHGGSLKAAIEMIEKAKEVGADAVKLQTFLPGSLTLDVQNKDFQIPEHDPWAGQSFHELFDKAKTPYEWHEKLFAKAKEIEIEIFSSPFDEEGVDFLESLNAPAYKIASPEISHIPLLRRVAKTKKPVIFSTGMASLDDIHLAYQTLRESGCPAIAILKCTSCYPTEMEDVDLNNIPFLKEAFQCPVGLSDHTLGAEVPIAAVALGAQLIEKHFKLDNSPESEDDFFSMKGSDFIKMVRQIRNVEKALGSPTYRLSEKAEQASYEKRSLYLCQDIKKGSVISRENIKCIRPSYGLHPRHYDEIMGKVFSRDGKKGERLSFDLVEMG